MNRNINQIIKTLSCGAAMAVVLGSAPARAQVVVEQGYPPPEFVATTQPVYFEGHPAYYWNGRWFYRMGMGWGAYREEPVFLHDWRARNPPPAPRYYEGHYGPHEGPREMPHEGPRENHRR